VLQLVPALLEFVAVSTAVARGMLAWHRPALTQVYEL
jgi:hypothetical protein